MLTVDIVNLATEETLAFIECHCPVYARSQKTNPARLLEVGCGKGHLAAALAHKGWRVRAVDSSDEAVAQAKARGVDCVQADFLTYDDKPFDWLLFARSLHHISPPELAMERAVALLRHDGLLLVEDFGADRADAAALAWLGQKRSQALSAGLCENKERHLEAMAGSLERWHHYYYEKHKIADSTAMLKAAEKSFSRVQVESAPYLYRYLLDIIRTDASGLAFVQNALAEEKSLIRADKIAAVGWRLICHKTEQAGSNAGEAIPLP